MRKSTIISTCLVNSEFFNSIDDTEHKVKSIFEKEFPASSFNDWNSNMADRIAQNIISDCGKASTINVRKFIEKLWDH